MCGDAGNRRNLELEGRPAVRLVPRPRQHLLTYYGVLAPNHCYRRAVVREPRPPTRRNGVATARPRLSHNQALLRAYGFFFRRCDHCGGQKRVLAVITDPPVVRAKGGMTNVRGVGSLVAFTLESPEARDGMLTRLGDRGLLALASGERAIRFRTPLNVDSEEIASALERIEDALPVNA